jgi:hypothetical protein
MREKRNAYRLLVGKPEGKRPLREEDIGGWIVLRWVLDVGVVWTALVWLRIGTSGGLL